MILLGIFVGPSALAGLATMLFLIPFQMVRAPVCMRPRGLSHQLHAMRSAA